MERVVLHVYDITNSPNDKTNETIVQINKFMRDGIGIGGIFHGAVEVYGLEWSFGYCPSGSGVFSCPPRANPMYSWRESVDLGVTLHDKRSVGLIIQRLAQEWDGPSYDLLNRNCNHFCHEMAVKLGTKGIPGWVNRLANLGDAAAEIAVASANQIQYIQNSLYGVGKAAYKCFWSGEGSPEEDSTQLRQLTFNSIPSADVDRLFPRSTQIRRSLDADVANSDLPKDGMGSIWGYFGANGEKDETGDSEDSEFSEEETSSQSQGKKVNKIRPGQGGNRPLYRDVPNTETKPLDRTKRVSVPRNQS